MGRREVEPPAKRSGLGGALCRPSQLNRQLPIRGANREDSDDQEQPAGGRDRRETDRRETDGARETENVFVGQRKVSWAGGLLVARFGSFPLPPPQNPSQMAINKYKYGIFGRSIAMNGKTAISYALPRDWATLPDWVDDGWPPSRSTRSTRRVYRVATLTRGTA